MSTIAQNNSLKTSAKKRESIREQILTRFESRDYTISEIEFAIGGRRATITGRFSEIHDDGLIKPKGSYKNDDNSEETIYTLVKDVEEQELISFERNRDKILKALKILSQNKKHLSNFINKAVEVEFQKLNK